MACYVCYEVLKTAIFCILAMSRGCWSLNFRQKITASLDLFTYLIRSRSNSTDVSVDTPFGLDDTSWCPLLIPVDTFFDLMIPVGCPLIWWDQLKALHYRLNEGDWCRLILMIRVRLPFDLMMPVDKPIDLITRVRLPSDLMMPVDMPIDLMIPVRPPFDLMTPAI